MTGIQCGGCARSIFSPRYTAGCRWCEVRSHTRLRHRRRWEQPGGVPLAERCVLYGAMAVGVLVVWVKS